MENGAQEFRLTELEAASAVWTRLRAYLEERLQTLRETNDNDLDQVQTARLRGEIRTIKQLLDVGQPPAKINIYD